MQLIETTELGMRSAVWVLARGGVPLKFRIFPMVHLGQQTFYDEVSRQLAGCDMIVMEGWGEEPAPGWFTRGYRRIRHLRREDFVYQNLRLPERVPVVWPDLDDLDPDRPPRPRWMRLAFVALIPVLPLLYLWFLLRGRARLAADFMGHDVNDDTSYHTEPTLLDPLILEDRDVRLVATLLRIYEAHEMDAMEVAVVYGAHHMGAVVHALNAAHGYRPTGGDWLVVMAP
ncbi:hypothetical protein G5C51_04760 [Streptomyces sp. A7024]|uniref:Uncharacterized protein n=1 Tax=Streptomyces coryli TaxID=1128680 RepID=A0A6G4TT69_9ACTN|nr:hypothetical protein [Streptomyces coryli]NGN63219.1 hypothetical protein [Streptomyces coryli]